MYRNRYGSIAPTQQRFEELKSHYRKLRDNFRNNPRSSIELKAWKNQDNNFDYHLLWVSYLLDAIKSLGTLLLLSRDGRHSGLAFTYSDC